MSQMTGRRVLSPKQCSYDFEIVNVAKERPSEGEVLIQTKVIALNPLDHKQMYVEVLFTDLPPMYALCSHPLTVPATLASKSPASP